MQSLVNITLNTISMKEQETRIFEQLWGSQIEVYSTPFVSQDCTPMGCCPLDRSLTRGQVLEWVNFGRLQVTMERLRSMLCLHRAT